MNHKYFTFCLLLCSLFLFVTSCKTAEKFSDKEKETMDQRDERNETALTDAGVDNGTKNHLLKELKNLDEEMFNFLGTNPDDDAQIAMMKQMRERRINTLKGKLSDDQLKAYLKSLSAQAKEIAKKKMKMNNELEGG